MVIFHSYVSLPEGRRFSLHFAQDAAIQCEEMWGAINVEIGTDSTRLKGAYPGRCLVLVPLSQLLWARILLQKRLRQSEQPMQNNINSNRAYRLLAKVSFIDSTCTSGTCGQFHPAEQHWLWLLQCTVASCLLWPGKSFGSVRSLYGVRVLMLPRPVAMAQEPHNASRSPRRRHQQLMSFIEKNPTGRGNHLGHKYAGELDYYYIVAITAPCLYICIASSYDAGKCYQVLCVGFLWATRSSDTNTRRCNDYIYII